MIEDPLFRSTHDALVFAFQYAGQQSPRTPMTSLFKTPGLGTGKGLSGLDGAAQAGMILAEVCRLPDDQHNVIVARYDRMTHECKCCGSEVNSEDREAAIDALSHCSELDGVHRKVRILIVKKVMCGGKLHYDILARQYSLAERSLYRQAAAVKVKYRKVENAALIALDNAFYEKKLLVA